MTTLDQIALRIIKEQELIIGPIAWSEAQKVSGLGVSGSKGSFGIEHVTNPTAIDGLISQYEHLFGLASHEVCRDAVKDLLKDLQPDQIPSSLK